MRKNYIPRAKEKEGRGGLLICGRLKSSKPTKNKFEKLGKKEHTCLSDAMFSALTTLLDICA